MTEIQVLFFWLQLFTLRAMRPVVAAPDARELGVHMRRLARFSAAVFLLYCHPRIGV